MALHPPKVRYVKPYQYRVQPGDDVGVITGYFGMPERKWPELVGANPSKALGLGAPDGERHRCFETLDAGERLNIPANWREPSATHLGLGAGLSYSPLVIPSGGTSSTVVDLLKMFQAAVATAGIVPPQVLNDPPPQIPAADLVDQLTAVIYSWWPHLGDKTLPNVPPIPTTPAAWVKFINDQMITEANWTLLFVSANEFLKATGIGQAEGPAVQKIPWPDIPWSTFPWESIASLPNAKDVWTKITALFARKDDENGPNTTSPILASSSQVNTPDFLHTDWASQPYAGLVGGTSWSDFLVEVMKDPRAMNCINSKPDQVAKLKDCPQCWSTPTQFVDLLCSSKDNPCDCQGGVPTVPPKEESSSSSNTGVYVAIGVAVVALALVAVKK